MHSGKTSRSLLSSSTLFFPHPFSLFRLLSPSSSGSSCFHVSTYIRLGWSRMASPSARVRLSLSLSPLSETDADKKDALPFGSNWSAICRGHHQPHYNRHENVVVETRSRPPVDPPRGPFKRGLKGRPVRPKCATARF